MTDRLKLPAWVFTDKAWYRTRPGREITRAIKDHIAAFGTPHMFPGHSHSKPGPTDRIVYLGEFDLPKSHAGKDNGDRWAPCPCCHLHYPKYFKNGMIAWFPDQGLIRMLGPQCFRKLNPEGHDSALAQYRKEQRIRRDIAFLLGHLHLLPEAMRAVIRGIEIAQAVDLLRTALGTRIDATLQIQNFWQHVRTGVLRVTEKREETVELPDGTTFTRDVGVHVDFGTLPGYQIFQPSPDELARELRNAFSAFRGIDGFGGARINPVTISDDDRRKVARVFERGLKTAARVFDEIETVRQLISPQAISTLARWGQHPGAPANFFVALEGRTLHLGKSEYEAQKSGISEAFFGVLPALPRIGEINIDDAPEVNLDQPTARDEEEIA